ncbi:TPA: T6SS amidase immunity protein Tai4 family protein [Vibrio harveyi]|uniref:T6SS amidase immunity protein Tai4 family protein n=1 Tax=Vibrio harveyi TaxID=669 RepID=UPI003CE6970F
MKTLKNSVWLGCVGWFYSLLVGASPFENHSNEQLLTNFALASCIATFYPKTEVAKDARVAMQGYVEFSDLSIEVFAGIHELIDRKAVEQYQAKRGGTVELAYCIDFSHSEQVQRLTTYD